MIMRSTSSFIVMLTTILCASGFSLPDDAGKERWVAGHRILKTFDDKNTGASFFGLNRIFQDQVGRYWVGHFFGVNLYDEQQGQWKSFSKKTGELDAYEIDTIGQSADGKLWFLSKMPLDHHLTCFDGERWHKIMRERWPILSAAPKEEPNQKHYPHELGRITTMFSGRNRLWFAVEGRLVAYDGRQWIPTSVLTGAIGIPNVDDTNVKEPEPAKSEDHSRFAIITGLEDRGGYIWLGTYNGIIRYDERKQEWKTYSKHLVVAYDIYEDRTGRIWFADSHGRVYLHDKTKDSWNKYDLLDHLPTSEVTKLAISPVDGSRLVDIKAIYQDKLGQTMFATSLGLVMFIEKDNKWKVFTPQNSGLPSHVITAILENHAGNIWIGTGKGIVVLEP